MTDQELVNLIRQGRKDLFSEVVLRYEEKISRYIKKFIWDRDDLDDVVQNVFAKSYIYLNTYDDSLSFNSWIYRIAHNESINFLKKNKPKDISFIDIDTFIPYLLAKENAEDKTLLRENKELIDLHLSELESKYREVIILFFYEDLDYEEISQILKIPKSTVGVRLSRAKQRLKNILEKSKNYESNLA